MGNAQGTEARKDAEIRGVVTTADGEADGGIITVTNGTKGAQPSSTGVLDPELVALRSLPIFVPLIRSTVADSMLLKKIEESPNSGEVIMGNTGVKPIDPTSTLLICRDYQEHVKLCAKKAVANQKVITQRFSRIMVFSENLRLSFTDHEQNARTFAEKLPAVEKIANEVGNLTLKISNAGHALRRLEDALTFCENKIAKK